jgi:predicted GNAT family acetyltransferase
MTSQSTDRAGTIGNISLLDNVESRRYELKVDTKMVGFIDYAWTGNVMRLIHTSVLPEHGGKGYGALLARRTLEHLHATGIQFVPECEFIAAYIAKHPRSS